MNVGAQALKSGPGGLELRVAAGACDGGGVESSTAGELAVSPGDDATRAGAAGEKEEESEPADDTATGGCEPVRIYISAEFGKTYRTEKQ